MPSDTDAAPTEAAAIPEPSPTIAPPLAVVPGRTLGVVGFALSIIPLTNLIGLVLSIVALVKSRRAGHFNGFALAGIVIASVGLLIAAIIVATAVPMLVDAAVTCARLGDGVHQIGQSTYTCTPTSFHVFKRW